MINSTNAATQTVNVNAPVLFANDPIKTGCTVRHDAGSGRFVITKPGIYRVTVGGVLSAPAATTAILNLYQDGEQVQSAQIQAIVSTTDIETSYLTRLVKVYCGGSVISLVNNSTAAVTLENANMVIDRLC